MPDFQIVVEDMLAVADRVAARFTGRGTLLGLLFGESPTLKVVTVARGEQFSNENRKKCSSSIQMMNE
jgi:predicted ester cyclase